MLSIMLGVRVTWVNNIGSRVLDTLLGVADIKNVINQLINCKHEKWYEGEKQMQQGTDLEGLGIEA